VKFLEQFGAEVWHPFSDGAVLHLHAEYADTACSANRSQPRFNCAYNQGRFNVEGYRYYDRVIGHTTDRDSETYSLGATYTAANGELWTVGTRYGFLNRDRQPDFDDTVATVRTEFESLELGWRGRWVGLDVGVDVGIESREPDGGTRNNSAFGYLSIQRRFQR
jgi:capsule assembly protein Wzi